MAKKTYLVIKAKTRREVELRKKKEENLQVYQKVEKVQDSSFVKKF